MTNFRHLDLGEFLPYLVNRLGSAMVFSFTQDALLQHGLSIVMWRVLAVLSNNGEQRQIDLAEMTSIEASTLSRLVARLVGMGLVTRRRSKSDNREVAVQLTAKGRGLVDKLIPIATELEQAAGAGLSKRDLAVVRRSLRRMYKNLARPRRPGYAKAASR